MLNPSTQPASDGRRRGLAVVRALIVLFLVAGLLATTTAPRPVGAAGLVGGDAEIGRYTFADLADRVLPSVVTVYVKQSMKMELSRGDRPDDLNRLRDFFRGNPGLRELFPELPDDEDQGRPESAPDLYDMDGEFVPTSSGSGIILSEDGYILTNHHVLSEGLRSAQNFTQSEDKQLTVVLGDGQEISGDDVKVVYSHPLADLAILKIDKSGLTPIKWGDSDKLRVGERIAAIGSPLDLKATVTQGIICAKNRDVANMSQLIQTDAVINPGSSGGALVNLDGELVGVNRLIATNTGRWQGFGFAIPSNDAKWFADEVISKGQIEFGYLGVLMWPETSEKMRMLSTLGFTPNQTGVLIQGLPDNPSVSEGNPARNAGLQVGDVIVEADGHPVRTNLDLLDYVRRRPVHSAVRIRVLRGNDRFEPQTEDFKVVLGNRPNESELRGSPEIVPLPDKPGLADIEALGLTLEPEPRGGDKGLKVVDVRPNSPAARSGLQPGDLIVQLNRKETASLDAFEKAIAARRDRHAHLLRFRRGGQDQLAYLEPVILDR